MTDVHPKLKELEEKKKRVAKVFQTNDSEGKPISLQIVFKDGTQFSAGVRSGEGLDSNWYNTTLVTVDGEKIIDR